MTKVLVICGPTATGKTKLALHLAEKLNGEIISADSRQVYKYFDVVTGKTDYFNKEVKIWGIDIADPKDEFSVKLYADYSRNKIDDISSRGKLPIMEGGTGFYIDAALKSFENINIPKNKKMRDKYESLTAEELFNIYMSIAPQKAILLNESDRKNKRRILRILEVMDFEMRGYALEISDRKDLYETLWVGLNYSSREELYSQIDKRVEDRLGKKLEEEIEFLKSRNYFEKASTTTPGYKYWDNPEKWKTAEHQYAKRQITWFKRNKSIQWFNAKDLSLDSEVEEFVRRWYSN